MYAPAKTGTTRVLLQPNFFGEYELDLDCTPVNKLLHRDRPDLCYIQLEVRHGTTPTHVWVMIADSYTDDTRCMTGERRFKLRHTPEGPALVSVELFRDGRWIEFVKID